MSTASDTARAVLAITDLTVDLPAGGDRPQAVRRISFEVKAGEIVCLLGESGSGKSVIGQTVMGLLADGLIPSRGSVRLLGEEVLQATAGRLNELRGARMAMVFQEPATALNPVMRCGDQVDEMLARHTRLSARERRARILAMFERVRLPDSERIFRAYPHQLSGGQRQRIVIAIALILKPALLICDEPTTALDVTTQAEILALIRELKDANGTAVLFVTHDFGVVAEIADRVVVLRLGDMVEQGAAASVLSAPREAYTRALIASVPGRTPPERRPVPHARPRIEAIGVGKSYVVRSLLGPPRTVSAAEDISLGVRPGETVGIVGESGSGKSTLARCMARLIAPTSGEMRVDGIPVAHATGKVLSALRRKVQVVFQDPYRSLNPRLTVGASIIEGPVNFGVSPREARERARALMHLVRLAPDALERYPSEFSGGQRQRICIARALACEPEVLIADEAVSALDVSVQAQILALLDEVQQRLGISILFITHDLNVASQICDRIVVMRAGRIVEQGATREVFLSPREPYTRTLLASAPGRAFFERQHPASAL
ncbi:dipeptide ABC transporter ATP-binding protein [Xanthobacter pseudotagetidis]|uniref:dipeptide ABC transporter ATP-binding protein n=1 Tax=Xanthobacter pseudotagetidis TaxID=3119911 RepID=UPI00372A304D